MEGLTQVKQQPQSINTMWTGQILTLYIQPSVGRQFSQFEGVNRLVLRVAVLHLQSLHRSFRCDLILVTVLQLQPVPDPLGSFYIWMGQFQREHSLLGLSHSLVPQSLLDLHSCKEMMKGWRVTA